MPVGRQKERGHSPGEETGFLCCRGPGAGKSALPQTWSSFPVSLRVRGGHSANHNLVNIPDLPLHEHITDSLQISLDSSHILRRFLLGTQSQLKSSSVPFHSASHSSQGCVFGNRAGWGEHGAQAQAWFSIPSLCWVPLGLWNQPSCAAPSCPVLSGHRGPTKCCQCPGVSVSSV